MLKLGEKIISDIYLGDKKIAKVFWSDKLVYQSNKPIFLDYISFDGASYIDTGIVPNDKTGSYVHLCSSSADDAIVLGCRESRSTESRCYLCATVRGEVNFGRDFYYYIHTDGQISSSPNSRLFIPYDTFYEQYTNYLNSRNIRVIEKSSNLDITTGAINVLTSTQTQSMFLGCAQVAGTTGFYFKGSIKQCVITEENQIVQDLRPCIDPKGTVCFYDMVTKKYFYNQGTGQFKAGGRFVKSIVFDGNSWIDTGINKQSCTIKCIVKLENAGYRQFLCGWSHLGCYYIAVDTSNRFELGAGVILAGSNATELSNVVAEHTKTKMELTVNGNYVKRTIIEQTEPDKNYWLGNVNSTSYSAPIKGEVYGHQFTSPDGVLIQDLRPFVDENEVACFYDMVTGTKFYNQGTGTLGYTEE